MLGSERSNLSHMSSREPFIVAPLLIIATYITLTLVGLAFEAELTLGTLVWTSFVISNIATLVRSCSKTAPLVHASPMSQQLSPDAPPTPISGLTHSGYSTPDRRLKLKHSGDANDWHASNSSAMKV